MSGVNAQIFGSQQVGLGVGLGLGDVLDHLRMLVSATPLPVNADFENGYADTPDGVAANVKDGIQINRTQIIGTIGAGKASRALVRLSNGRVLTLRLGDKINGGTITDIGDSRITFVKGGQQQALSVLGGR